MVVDQIEDDDEALLRSLTWCEEDRRRLYPGIAWRGEYRWFRSSNVIPLERYRPSGWKWDAPGR
jgi:hypothetical protein